MKMSEGVEWAIHSLSLLASVPEGRSMPGAALAEFFDIPQTYLAEHLQHLSRAGLVQAVRGPGGGYQLAKPATKISLLDVVFAIEGEDPCFKCTEIRQQGPSGLTASHYKRPCGIHVAMRSAEQAWRNELSKVSIAQMSETGLRQTPRAQTAKALKWFEKVLK